MYVINEANYNPYVIVVELTSSRSRLQSLLTRYIACERPMQPAVVSN